MPLNIVKLCYLDKIFSIYEIILKLIKDKEMLYETGESRLEAEKETKKKEQERKKIINL